MDLDIKALEEHFAGHHGEVKDLIAEVKTKLAGVQEELAEMQQKSVRQGGGGAPGQSLGEKFVESESFKGLAGSQNQRGRAELQTKATITTVTTDAAGSAGAGTVQPYRDGLVLMPRRRMTVRNLLPVVNISSGSVEVPRMTARNNNAAPVAEGGLKPASDLELQMLTVTTRVIAHYIKASRQVLDDAPQLRDLIDGELLYGLAFKEETELLTGDGTGQHLLGLIPQATAYSAPISIVDSTMIDQIGLALLQNALALFPADGIVMNSASWLQMQLLKNGVGDYILGEPQAATQPRLWGVPVVPTPAMSVNKFLVGDFQAAATIYDRWTARVEVATENEDDFIKNLLTILGEERIALAVKQPLALTYGDFTAP